MSYLNEINGLKAVEDQILVIVRSSKQISTGIYSDGKELDEPIGVGTLREVRDFLEKSESVSLGMRKYKISVPQPFGKRWRKALSDYQRKSTRYGGNFDDRIKEMGLIGDSSVPK